VIVVADTSVILNLCRIQHERLLPQLFGRVVVPEEVASEFSRLCAAEIRFTGLGLPTWIQVQPSPQPIPDLVRTAHLDAGETAAIALGLSLVADALPIDERLGREVANRLGLRTIGILGVLLESHRRGLIPEVKAVLDRLRMSTATAPAAAPIYSLIPRDDNRAHDALPRHECVALQTTPLPMKRIGLSAALLCGVLCVRWAAGADWE
jgi:hypothetical protein